MRERRCEVPEGAVVGLLLAFVEPGALLQRIVGEDQLLEAREVW